ncbi:MAG TPA: hypothetical protein VJR25_04760 [Microbacterium sp.]|uniref:hypothetical protein n=1 Tax=Microbacterium sp. TaxID=51671 RepID=UPI002B461675|nr:hypothetical protein [Microbacterium sp.]HKT56062.1 hypothetical protein [Microbacterium sp.]
MSNQHPNNLPLPLGDEDEPDTVEVDGTPVLDPDANADDVDSAEADRLAAEHGDDPDEPDDAEA